MKCRGFEVICTNDEARNYFTRREAISFNIDGFIGFAGWADSGNLNPLKRAFLQWCDYLKSTKEE